MAKKKSQPVEKIRLSGRNIYTDKKGRVIYYDRITKKGYLVDKERENAAQFYKNRMVVILFAAILCGATFMTVTQAVIGWAVLMLARSRSDWTQISWCLTAIIRCFRPTAWVRQCWSSKEE